MLSVRSIFSILLFFVLFSSFSVFGGERSIQLSFRQTKFIRQRVFYLPVPEAQRKLEDAMRPLAEQYAAFDGFEKKCRQILQLPPDPQEACNIVNEINSRLQKKNEFDPQLFEARVNYWYSRGYMVSYTQMLPVRLFLRQFYDDHKIRRKTADYDVEEISSESSNTSVQNNIVRITAEGDGDTERSAVESALKEALNRGDTYWYNRIESTSSSDGERLSSSFKENTDIIRLGLIKGYDVISSYQTPDGGFKVIINATIQKNLRSQPLNIPAVDLHTEYERIENEYKIAGLLKQHFQEIPAGLINVRHKERLLDRAWYQVDCTLSVNISEYQRWIGKARELLSSIAVSQSSFATGKEQLQSFLQEAVHNQNQNFKSFLISDFKRDDSLKCATLLQLLNLPETIFYRKYSLRHTLAKKIFDGFVSNPQLVVELVDKFDKKIAERIYPLKNLGITFLPENNLQIPAVQYNNMEKLPLKTFALSPFFFDGTGNENSLWIKTSFDLRVSQKLYEQKPLMRIYVKFGTKPQEQQSQQYSPGIYSLEEGKIQYNLENFEEAFRIFKHLAQKNNTEAIIYMGRLYHKWKKDPDTAVYWLKKVSDANALNEIGDIYLSQARFDDALEVYRQSAQTGNWGGLGRYGKLLLQSDPQAGEKYLKEAVKSGSRSASFYLAEYYRTRKQRDWQQAFSYYKNALTDKKPSKHYDICMYYLGYCYAYGLGTTEDRSEALHCFAKVSSESNKFADAQYHSGLLHKKAGNKKEAIQCFQEAADRKHPDAALACGIALLQSDAEKAWQYLQPVIARHPERAYIIGIELLKLGNTQQAKNMFQKCTGKNNPHQAMALFQLGKIYEAGDKSDQKKAREYYLAAAKLELPQALYLLAIQARTRGELQKCHHYLKRANGYAKATLFHAKLYADKNFSGYSLTEAESLCLKAREQSIAEGDVATTAGTEEFLWEIKKRKMQSLQQ